MNTITKFIYDADDEYKGRIIFRGDGSASYEYEEKAEGDEEHEVDEGKIVFVYREAYEYFISFYPSFLYNPINLTFEFFRDELKRYYDLKKNSPSPLFEFASIEREVMRDRVLYLKTREYVGYIFSVDEKGTYGVEDLIE